MYEIISYALVAVASIITGGHLVHFLHKYFRAHPEPEPCPLSDATVRNRLSLFMTRHKIYGDAQIIDGVVHPVATINAHPLAMVFRNAVSHMDRMQNPAASSIYIRDSVNDRFLLLADLDVDHLRDAAMLLSAVAERKKH